MKPLTEKQKQDRRDAQKRWYLKHKDVAKKRARDKEYRRKYGIDLEKYDEILKIQQNLCAICERSCDTGMNLAVDHCHTTKKVRGLLCKNCNTAIGLFKENIENMKKAISYIEFHTIMEEIA